MHDREKQLKDIRTMEAIQKNLMGAGGKIGVIVKHLGEKIRSHGSACLDSTMLSDPWFLEDEDGPNGYSPERIYDMEDFGEPTVTGWYFDGLNRGMHLEIKYIEDTRDLTVQFKGYVVFREIEGQLDCYAPNEDWEELIERLYSAAHQKAVATGNVRLQENKKTAARKAVAYLDKMRLRWGL